MAVGIIAEYNPFHAGHAYQINEVRKNFSEIIAVMSGNFTQRGEPAILDKWTRASLAVEGGCDLVIELPFVSAVRSAQDFARGAIDLLNKLGVVDKLAFGAEVDIKKLKTLSEINLSDGVKKFLAEGLSYANAVGKILSAEKLQPNTILAMEYLRALPDNIKPILIERVGAAYNNLNLTENFASASAIRAEVYKNNPDWNKILRSVNEKVLCALQAEKNCGLVREDFLFRPILAKVFTNNAADIKKIFGMAEGLENNLIKSARIAKNYSELVNLMVSRRYQKSRIKRLLIYFLLGLTEEKILNGADYVRILAFNKVGQKLLKKIRANSNLVIINRAAEHKEILTTDIAATNLRNILFDTPRKINQDFFESPKFLN